MGKIKNAILMTFTGLNLISFFFFACWLDSGSWIPLIIMCTNAAWIALFAFANDIFEEV